MPVVPASPSIKTFFLAKSDDDDDDNDDLIGFNVEKAEAWAAKRMKAADSFILLFLSKNFQVMMKVEKARMCRLTLRPMQMRFLLWRSYKKIGQSKDRAVRMTNCQTRDFLLVGSRFLLGPSVVSKSGTKQGQRHSRELGTEGDDMENGILIRDRFAFHQQGIGRKCRRPTFAT
jgi:hypothetical protein